MDTEKNKPTTTKEHTSGDPGSAHTADHPILEQGAEVYKQAEQTASDVYAQAKNYSHANPGKAILVAAGIGVGLGLLLSARTRRSRSRRIAQPVVDALYDIASELLR